MGTQAYNDVVGALEEVAAEGDEVGDEIGDEIGAKRPRKRVRVARNLMSALRKADPAGRLWSVGIRSPNALAQVAIPAATANTALSFPFTIEGTILRGVSWSPDLDIANLTLANEPLSTQQGCCGMFVWDPRVDRTGLDPLEGLKVPMNATIGGTIVNPTAAAVFFRLDVIIWTGRLPDGRTIKEMAGG